MGGGLMQLVAYGAQDIYLTGNPQITFFKVVYRRHTNFAMESIEQTYSGQADFGKRFTVTIARNGDLLGRVYLQVDVAEGEFSVSSLTRLGHQLIDYVEVEIGGQIIDKHYGEWMDVWCQLSHSQEQWEKLVRLVDGSLVAGSDKRLYIPLQFWFCRNPGLYLPLIALQYHEVKLNINLQTLSNIKTTSAGSVVNGDISIDDMSIYCDYVFLDTDERRRFAQVSHEYLIEQVQYNNAESISANASTYQSELRFNHPVKELVWWVKNNSYAPFNYFGDDGGDEVDQVSDCLIQLNGHDRFKRREGTYFRCVQTYQHHTGGHNQSSDTTDDVTGGMYVYSFGLKPEEHQPSGTCNFSRIDNAVLNLTLKSSIASSTLKVWAVNYNVLRIMSGMGGLAYSN
jgi:hypothetical protein